MTVRLYCDEDSMRHALVAALRKRGFDVSTALEAGNTEKTDEQQLGFAAADERAIYSFNVGDFCRLHAEWLATEKSHAGIILAQQQFPIGDQMRRLVRLLNALSAEDMHNRLEFLSDWGAPPAP